AGTHGQTRAFLEQNSGKPRTLKSNTSARQHSSPLFPTWQLRGRFSLPPLEGNHEGTHSSGI
ncbi:hypothetical protein A2U01_0100787, partial [Trifolium medium]|nr:hypothetical protein [Trifolium medium]